MTTLRRSPSVAAPLLLLLAASPALAAPPGEASDEQRFFDGGVAVVARRLAPVSGEQASGGLSPVRLSYSRGRVVDAYVGATAIARLDPDADPADLEAEGVRLLRPLAPSLGLWLVQDTGGADGLALAARVSAPEDRPLGVVEIVPDLYLAVQPTADPYTPTDPRYGGQWYFENLGMPEAWGLSTGSADTTIVVVDTGCDLAHPDLASKLDPGLDVVDGDDDPSFEPTDDGAAHGTECAGLVGAATDNDEGIAGGCPECRVRCVRMLSDQLTPLSADIDAFQFALDVDADVVSNSWGFVDSMPVPSALADIITEVATNGRGGQGALVLFAAGNDDREIADDELQAVEGVLCIGAINNFDESTPFTNRGNALDLVAPTGTLTTDISGAGGEDPSDYTSLFGGTSSACPVAAGVAGLLATVAADKTGAELGAILIETARPAPFAVPDANGHDALYGYGIIDPPRALAVAMGLEGEGGAGTGGSAAGGAGQGGEGADGPTADDDGCGCAVPRSSPLGGSAYLLLGGALALLRLRRNR